MNLKAQQKARKTSKFPKYVYYSFIGIPPPMHSLVITQVLIIQWHRRRLRRYVQVSLVLAFTEARV